MGKLRIELMIGLGLGHSAIFKSERSYKKIELFYFTHTRMERQNVPLSGKDFYQEKEIFFIFLRKIFLFYLFFSSND